MANGSDNPLYRESAGKIFLVGFMGSGKTYWGKIWAQQFGIDFYDLDEIIENKEGRSISAIFENDGEDYFREMEAIALKGFGETKNGIIACGGGTASFKDNMQWMNENGTTIYLLATPPYIFDRILDVKEKRPLINKYNGAELLFFIEQKIKEREPYYKQAKIILPVTELNKDSLINLNL